MKFFKNLLFGDQNSSTGSEKTVVLTEEEYKKKGLEALNISWNLLNSTDGWKLEKQTAEGDSVYSKYLPGLGKIFKLTGEANFPPKRLLTEVFTKIENVPTWNPTILEAHKIQVIDEFTDVSYVLTAGAAGGLVSSREFVSVRKSGMKDGCYISAGISTAHPAAPPPKKFIRGENGPNCWVMRPIPGTKDRCIFQWLLNTHLHGWLPQYAVDAALTNAMLDYLTYVRAYGKRLREQGDISA